MGLHSCDGRVYLLREVPGRCLKGLLFATGVGGELSGSMLLNVFVEIGIGGLGNKHEPLIAVDVRPLDQKLCACCHWAVANGIEGVSDSSDGKGQSAVASFSSRALQTTADSFSLEHRAPPPPYTHSPD